jgi:argininosuccinate lyase
VAEDNDVKHAWAGRFSASPIEALDAINKSIGFDRRLWREDIEGSRAHAEMLQQIGVLTEDELHVLLDGLDDVATEFENDTFEVSDVDEDIHMAVERRLTEIVGEPGKKLHSGRSRNDQVATDVRLFTRRAASEVQSRILVAIGLLLDLAGEHAADPLPAYTHLQRGMPTTLGHHLVAYASMLQRDYRRFVAAHDAADVSPLGSGACVGSSLPLNRQLTANTLGFSDVTYNSLDGVSDRDFVLDFIYASSVLMMHLSRLGEELIIWSTHEFGFAQLGDAVTTGSSMMPNKKNPDGAELLRGKAGRVFGNLIGLLSTLKGLPLTYNKDMQEDKEPLFDSFDTAVLALDMLAAMLEDITFDTNRMRLACRGWVNATDLCEALVRKGVPLRTAHEQAGELVAKAVEEGVELEELPLEDVQEIAHEADAELLDGLKLEAIVANKDVVGGTAPRQVAHTIERLREFLSAELQE